MNADQKRAGITAEARRIARNAKSAKKSKLKNHSPQQRRGEEVRESRDIAKIGKAEGRSPQIAQMNADPKEEPRDIEGRSKYRAHKIK